MAVALETKDGNKVSAVVGSRRKKGEGGPGSSDAGKQAMSVALGQLAAAKKAKSVASTVVEG